jgi:hypothetical protein
MCSATNRQDAGKNGYAAEGIADLWRDKTRPSRISPLRPEIAERVVALTLATLVQSPASE